MKSFNTEHEHPAAESGDVFAESNPTKNVDDDGREKRTGTWLTASAHIITAVIGSGVLSLSWAIAQLGWIAGLLILVIFSFITYFTSTMLADCYRAPDPVTGKRNYTYMDVVRSYLGKFFFLVLFSLVYCKGDWKLNSLYIPTNILFWKKGYLPNFQSCERIYFLKHDSVFKKKYASLNWKLTFV